ncbi:MAG: hypothetical protein HQK88_11165 [Nitrospirae bacterium]|nr:hypothetical protein [Nitrospirota bacterium]MBF0535508.1 hypothetical protein [Nitrospirota bacterium]MBF0617360.1 hypothetical protein [Nitrospirota bacterium]
MPNKIKKLMIDGGSRLKKQNKKAETHKAAKSGGKGSVVKLKSPVNKLKDSGKTITYKDLSTTESALLDDAVDKLKAAVMADETDNLSEGNDDSLHTAMPENPDDFIARNITPQMKESLKFVLKSNISLDCLEVIEQVSVENKNLVNFLKKIDKYDLAKICEITDEDNYVITAKMLVIALLNKISKNEIIHKLLRRTGALIQALRRLKELLLANL